MHIGDAVEFEWDDAKEARNIQRHGVEFDEAVTTFYDPLALIRLDEQHSNGEERFVLLGGSRRGRMLVTIFVERGRTIRIVSSRPATRREVRAYEEGV
jgi:uncharacterized protein